MKTPLITPNIFAEIIKAIVANAERDRKQAVQLLKEKRK